MNDLTKCIRRAATGGADCRNLIHLIRNSVNGARMYVCSVHRLEAVRAAGWVDGTWEDVHAGDVCALKPAYSGSSHGPCTPWTQLRVLRGFNVDIGTTAAAAAKPRIPVWLCEAHQPAAGRDVTLPADHPVMVMHTLHQLCNGDPWTDPSPRRQRISQAQRNATGLPETASPIDVWRAIGTDNRLRYVWDLWIAAAYGALLDPDDPDLHPADLAALRIAAAASTVTPTGVGNDLDKALTALDRVQVTPPVMVVHQTTIDDLLAQLDDATEA